MNKGLTLPAALLAIALGASWTGCASKGSSTETPPPPANNKPPAMKPDPVVDPVVPPVAFQPLPPRAYASKVKDLLTGLALDDNELRAVTDSPAALAGLIDTWMTLPSFQDKLLIFFQKAFQQTQIAPVDLDDQFKLASAGASAADQKAMVRSVVESFARTAIDIVQSGRPFTDAVTTNKFMLNVPMMAALAYMDAAPQDDLGKPVQAGYWHLTKFGPKTFKFVQTTNIDPVTMLPVAIPFEDSINPASPSFMMWTFTQPDPLRYKPCADVITLMGPQAVNFVFRALFGSRQACQGAPSAPPLFTADDWNTWRLVTIRPPQAGEERTTFWELPKLRDPKTTELVLAMPRVGFLTTPAFFANWPTNASNAYRVTTNQALIVGLGRSFDDSQTTVQVSESSVDAQHAQPGTVCYSCHQMLDPMRDFYKQTYSLLYFQQLSALNPKNPPLPPTATFNVDGVTASGTGVQVFAQAMAAHPRFAGAWTQKLCQMANASPCNEDDPEFKRVASAFAQSRFDFKTLVRTLFSSPLVTYAAKATGTDVGFPGIARRDEWCDRLSVRLGVKDLCNQRGDSTLPKIAGQARNLSLGVPGSGYERADEHPVTPHDPNMFFASGTEKLCMVVAGQLVEGPTGRWKVATKDAAIAEFVSLLMGVPPSDPMTPKLNDILARHYAAAVTAKELPADALRSTFTLACSSPLAVSSGL